MTSNLSRSAGVKGRDPPPFMSSPLVVILLCAAVTSMRGSGSCPRKRTSPPSLYLANKKNEHRMTYDIIVVKPLENNFVVSTVRRGSGQPSDCLIRWRERWWQRSTERSTTRFARFKISRSLKHFIQVGNSERKSGLATSTCSYPPSFMRYELNDLSQEECCWDPQAACCWDLFLFLLGRPNNERPGPCSC